MRYLKNNREWQLHLLMAMIGGIYGAYALEFRGAFGSAMTGNFLDVAGELARITIWSTTEEIPTLLLRIGAALIFGFAMVLCTMLKTRTKLPMQKVTLIIEAIGMILTVFIPMETEPILALYPIFFLSSFQWGTFSGVKEYGCATIFSTNNFRQCVTAWAEYTLTHQEKDRRKGSFYGMTILSFLIGGYLGTVSTEYFAAYGLLLGLLPLSFAFTRLENETRDRNKEKTKV